MKAIKIRNLETGQEFASFKEGALFLQDHEKFKGKRYEGNSIMGKMIYRRLWLHVTKTPYHSAINKKGIKKEYLIKSIFGLHFEFVEDDK